MAYNMKSSPAKLGAALRTGKLLVKYGKKLFTKTPPKKVVKSADDIEADEINRIYDKFKQNIRDKGTKSSPVELNTDNLDFSLSGDAYDAGGSCIGSNCQQRSFMPVNNLSIGPKINVNKTGGDYSGSLQGSLRYTKNPKPTRSGQKGFKFSTKLEGGAKMSNINAKDFKDGNIRPTFSSIAGTTTQIGYQGEAYDPKSRRSHKKGRDKFDLPTTWGAGAYHKKNIIGGDKGNEFGGFLNYGNLSLNVGKSKSGWKGGISIGKFL